MYQGIAAAKINLVLDVQQRRTDGYHLLESVMQTLSLCDIVEVELAVKTSISCDLPNLSCGEDNLAWRAWTLLQQEFQLDAGLKITLHKQIPLAGGLAGGSSDAAQILLAVNTLFALNLSQEKMLTLAARLGADVPFCLLGGTALAKGVGDELQTLAPCPELRLVLVNPGFAVDTAAVYRQFDLLPPGQRRDGAAQAMAGAIAAGDPGRIAAGLYNNLEEPAFQLFPQLAALKEEMLRQNLIPLLCGSGGTIFGIAADKKRAAVAAANLTGKYPFVQAVTTKNYS